MNKTILSCVTILFAICFTILLKAQGDGVGDFKFRINSMLQNRMTTPGAPEAASLGKYGAYKVNTYTGLPVISIPLYALQGSELSMQFGLNYDGGGIKVEQLPTWVGIGWNLNGGGVITRSVKGDPDLKSNYFNFNTLLNQNSNAPYSNDFTENDFLLQAATKEVETQPDIFFFNMGTHSGKFFIKADQSIVMAESKDLLITPYFNGATGNIDSFYVKDAMGITYIFNVTETTTLSYSSDYGPLSRFITQYVFNSSWYLSRIINANATETVELKYITEGVAFNPYQFVNLNNYKSISYHHGFLSAGAGCTDPTCPYGDFPVEYVGAPTATSIANRRFLDEVILKKGVTPVEKIKFSSSVNALTEGGRKLDTLSLYKGANAGSRILNQVFTYGSGTGRLTLNRVQESSPGGTSKEPYDFTYSATALPTYTSNAIDHWGYYNNATSNTNLIPAITCAGINSNINSPNCSGMNNPNTGANRNPDTVYSKAGVLTRITYPTKGYTDFVWESNRAITGDLICGDTPMERVVGGLRIKEINNYSFGGAQLLTSKKYYYKFANGTCSGLLFYTPHYYTSSTFTTYAYPLSQCPAPAATSGTRYTYTFNSSSITPLGALQGGLVGYTRVEESFAGKTIYNYKNYIPGFVAWGLLEDMDIQDLGQLQWVEEYNDAGQKVHSMGYKYSFDVAESKRSKSFYGLVVDAQDQQDNKTVRCLSAALPGGTFSWQLNGDNSYTCYQSKIYPSKFIRRHYRITQDWVFNKETTDSVFFYNGASLTGTVPKLVINTFGNDSVSLPTSVEMTNSDGKLYKKITRFPHDVGSSTMKTNLLNLRMYAVPLETENLVNGTIAYRTRLDYNTFLTTGLQGAGPWLLPHKFYERYTGSDILRETISQYDLSGTHVQEGYKEYDQPNVLLYSHTNMLPAAKIQNATSAECAYTGFETGDAVQGGWTFSNPSGGLQPDVDAKTGKGQWNGTGTISKSGIPAGKYLLSYWILTQTTALTVTGATSNTSVVNAPDPGGWRYVQHTLVLPAAASISITGGASIGVDELRLYPYDALMTTYSYDRNTRLLSGMANENSMPNKFEYDGLLRLTGIRNFNNYYLKTLEYIYKTSGVTYNAVKSRDVLQDAVTSTGIVNGLTGGNVKRMFDFFDDIGRVMQNMGVGQSPTSLDVIVHHDYDAYGREANKYLPFTNAAGGAYLSTAATAQSSFYTSQFGGSEGTYAKVVTSYENSPLGRVLSETPQGSVFNSHPVSYVYSSNGTNEVRDFKNANSWYVANTLYKVKRFNENGDSTLTYTNKIGQKIMESTANVKTYYLYDDRQNLIYVIQPHGAYLGHTFDLYDITYAAILNRSFAYTYDALNNLATRTIPSGGTYTYTYDRLDREVLRSDPNGFRFFTKYDILGRVCITGKHTVSTGPTGSEPLFEIPNVSTHNYTTQAYPTSSIDIYSVNYYDDYDWDKNGTQDSTYTAASIAGYPASSYPYVLAKPTRIKSGVLQQSGAAPASYNDEYLFYDEYGREIQRKTYRTAVFNNNVDRTWKLYDFAGRVLKSRLAHIYGSTTTYINERYTYDHASRLRSTYHQINDAGPEMRLDSMSYNERDELMQKMISFNGVTPGQTVDYSYNIRKWLTKINDPAVACGSNPDLYSQQLYYDVANASLNSTAKYNGNIAWTEWRTNSAINVCTVNGVNRDKAGYGYTYDGLDRMIAAKYEEFSGGAWTNVNKFKENLTYDLNGNILTLGRRGFTGAGTYGLIDTLTYTYDGTNIHRINTITDGSSLIYGYKSASGSYTYDSNGNMITDGSKGITAITYNHLNLPTKYTFTGGNTIEIQYDASGRKLKKILSTGTTKSYIGNIEYVGSTVEAIYHAEGRARNNAGTYVYEYAIKDHLGNTRVVFTYTSGTLAFVQENHYYPFGMEQGGWTADPNPPFAYKYNGKELNGDFGLNLSDYGARWYDAGIGRWTTLDPKADKMPAWSPYNYTFNNPIKHIDPDGAFPYPVTIRSFAPPGAFKNTGGFRDDGRGFSSRSDVTSRISQSFTVDPSARSITGGRPTSDKTFMDTPLGTIGSRASDKGSARAEFSKSAEGNVATVASDFKGSNPFFLGLAPNIKVSSNLTLTENLEKGTLGVNVNLSSKQFPATEAIIQDSKNQSVFLGVAAAYGNPGSLISADEKQVSSLSFTISINGNGEFQSISYGNKNYTIDEFNKTFSNKSAGPYPRNQAQQ